MDSQSDEKSGVLSRFKTVWSFVRKHAMIFTLLLVLGLQFVPNDGGSYPWGGLWMRMLVKDLPVADSAAASSVENYITNQISGIAAQQYPNLPEANRQKVIVDLKEKFRKENSEQLKTEQDRLALEIREHYSYEENGRKFLYMPDIDPYYYLRFARNIVEKGHKYDVLKDNIPWDNHMMAPIGVAADRSWHPQLLALMFNIHSTFDSTVSLMESANYHPVFFIFLSIIVAFLLGYRIAGPIGGFFSGTVISLLPAVIGRTPWGHPDTDGYIIFFPLLVVWLFYEALSAKSTKHQFIWASLTGLAFGLYANFWAAWWYLFNFVGGAIVIALLLDVLVYRKLFAHGFKNFFAHSNIKTLLRVGLSIFFVTAVFCSLTIGFQAFSYGAFQAAVKYSALKEASLPDLWPNTLTTVAELNPASFAQILGSVGGKLMFIVGLLGIFLLCFKRDEHGKLNFAVSALLVIWFLGTVYMSLKGVRFVLLIGPAFAVAFGAGAGLLYQRLSSFGERQLHLNKNITGVLVCIVMALLIVNPAGGSHMVRNSYNSVIGDVPIMNDAWWNSLIKIRDNSQPDAIINSWWDFGHHFKYVADRAVSFDGASQTLPHNHWVGRVLQTDNEAEAVAILRMLDCGANSAYDVVMESLKDPLLAVNFVKKIILMDKESARLAVQEAGVDEKILNFTHCDPPEDFFIASADMIGKSGVWAHFGLWDFERAETWLKWRLLDESSAVPDMASRFNVSEDDAKKLYRSANSLSSEESANAWISPWPGYVTSDPRACEQKLDVLDCGSIVLNLSSKRAEIRADGTALAGKVVVYSKDGSKKSLEPSEGNPDLGVVVWPTESGYSAIAAYSVLVDSMFTRMYYMGGLGLKHFIPFSAERQLIGGMIFVYKVDWSGASSFVPESLKPKESVVAGAKVHVSYIGWTDEGVFDASIPNWKELGVSKDSSFDDFQPVPLPFVVGKGQIIPGFESRIQGMKVGEVKTITIPPQEAYGVDPSKHALGNKTLNFKLRIEKIE